MSCPFQGYPTTKLVQPFWKHGCTKLVHFYLVYYSLYVCRNSENRSWVNLLLNNQLYYHLPWRRTEISRQQTSKQTNFKDLSKYLLSPSFYESGNTATVSSFSRIQLIAYGNNVIYNSDKQASRRMLSTNSTSKQLKQN